MSLQTLAPVRRVPGPFRSRRRYFLAPGSAADEQQRGIASTSASGWLTTVAPSRSGTGRGPGAGARPGDPSSPAGHDPREARGHTSRRSN